MKEFSKSYRIRENSCYITSLATLSYEYLFSNNIRVIVPPVIDYSEVPRAFPGDQMYAPEMRVTTKYEVV